MAFSLVSDELWAEVEPLLPPEPDKSKGGRPRKPDRACLTGIVLMLRTGMPWNMIPQELGGGVGSTCWRRFQEWTLAGVWSEVHKRLLRTLGHKGEIDLERAVVDSASVRAVLGGSTRGQTRRTERKGAASATS